MQAGRPRSARLTELMTGSGKRQFNLVALAVSDHELGLTAAAGRPSASHQRSHSSTCLCSVFVFFVRFVIFVLLPRARVGDGCNQVPRTTAR
jgi:hypothetical protein